MALPERRRERERERERERAEGGPMSVWPDLEQSR